VGIRNCGSFLCVVLLRCVFVCVVCVLCVCEVLCVVGCSDDVCGHPCLGKSRVNVLLSLETSPAQFYFCLK
jgi:hypothetical protein